MRPKLIALVAVSAIGLSLTACATESPSSEPTATVTVTATPSKESVETAELAEPSEEKFLSRMATMENETVGISDDELLEAGYKACENYEYGSGDKSPSYVDAGNYTDMVNTVITLTATELCPENMKYQ